MKNEWIQTSKTSYKRQNKNVKATIFYGGNDKWYYTVQFKDPCSRFTRTEENFKFSLKEAMWYIDAWYFDNEKED